MFSLISSRSSIIPKKLGLCTITPAVLSEILSFKSLIEVTPSSSSTSTTSISLNLQYVFRTFLVSGLTLFETTISFLLVTVAATIAPSAADVAPSYIEALDANIPVKLAIIV